MKRGSTLFLRIAIIILGLLVLGICIFGLPQLIISELSGDFDYGPIFVGLYITAVPFFIALYKAMQLLNFIDHNNAFSVASLNAFKTIKYCGLTISGLFIAGMPYIFYVGDTDDSPGVVALSLVIIFTSFVIATAAAVFQSLVQNAVDIKSENDLTV